MLFFLIYAFMKPPPKFSSGGGHVGGLILMRLGRGGVNTSPALTAPCWPPYGRCELLLKTRRIEQAIAQSFTLLRQKFWQHPVSADTEAAAPLNDLLRDLTEILSPKIGVPEPAIEICHRQHHPIAVLGSVDDIIGV